MLVTDLKYYKSTVVSGDSTNGGPISNNEAVSGVVNNIWPHVLKAERDSGSVLWRKVFLKVVTNTQETFLGSQMWNESPTAADDYIDMFPGTADDTQATVSTADGYCAGVLTANAAATSSTLQVQLEDAAQAPFFPDTRLIRITDKSTPESGTGTEEQHLVSGTPVLVGDVLTITLATPLENSYVIGDKVQGVYESGDITGGSGNLVVTSTAGTFDDTIYPPTANNAGAVSEEITLEFTDATSFTVVGSVTGALASGTVSVDYTPSHPVSGYDMFTIDSAAFGGTYALGDTVVFDIVGAYAPFWLRRTVPAGAGGLADNVNTTYTYGQS